jgi:hypothetical protein
MSRSPLNTPPHNHVKYIHLIQLVVVAVVGLSRICVETSVVYVGVEIVDHYSVLRCDDRNSSNSIIGFSRIWFYSLYLWWEAWSLNTP